MDALKLTIFLLTSILTIKAQCPADFSPLPNYDSCESFFNCSTGIKIQEECPSGTYYNCMTKTCETSTYSFCCASADTTIYLYKNGVNAKCLNGTVARDYTYLDTFYTCIDGIQILTGICDPGYLYCEASKSCYWHRSETCSSEVNHNSQIEPFASSNGFLISPGSWALCPNDNTNFNDPNDCTVYYNCSTGTANLYKCPEGFYYDCFNDVCSVFVNKYCCTGDTNVNSRALIMKNLYRCKDRTTVYSADFDNLFFECYNNNILFGECNQLSYCNTTKACYDPNVTTCNKTITLVTDATTSTETTTTSSSTTNMNTDTTTSTTKTADIMSTTLPATTNAAPTVCFSQTSAIAVPNNCSQYFNNSGIFSCPSNLLFNSFKKCCLPPQEIFNSGCNADRNKPLTNNMSCSVVGRKVENTLSCNSYYQCNSSSQIEMKTCPSKQLFDWKVGGCVSVYSATVAPGCTATKYNQCLNNNNNALRGRFCSIITWIPKFLFKNIGNYCKSVLCSVTWFI